MPTLLHMGAHDAPCPTPLPCPASLCVPCLLIVLCCSISICACTVSRSCPSTPCPCRQAQQQQTTAINESHNMCNTISTFATLRGNIYNIRPKQFKYSQHMSETLAKHLLMTMIIVSCCYYIVFYWHTMLFK
jgi:hypothetical protein